MATRIQNNKNFLIVEVSWKEYVALTDSWGMCDCCGDYDSEMVFYYVAVIDSFLCKTCFDAWYSTAKRYSVDIEKERQNYNKKKSRLKDLGVEI